MSIRFQACLFVLPFLAAPTEAAPFGFDFNTPPPFSDWKGDPVVFMPLTESENPFFSGTWLSSGGNTGGFIRQIRRQLDFHSSAPNVFFTGGSVSNYGSIDDRFSLFGPSDSSATISFDFRVQFALTGGVVFDQQRWVVLLASNPEAFVGTFPYVYNDGATWQHVVMPVNNQTFPDLPSDPTALVKLLQTFNRFAITLENRTSNPNPYGTVTSQFDMDNLVFGTPTPEPSSAALLFIGVAGLAIGFLKHSKSRRCP